LYLFKKQRVKIPKRGEVVFWKEVVKHDPLRERPAIDPKEDVAIFLYTGGTTGIPQGRYVHSLQSRREHLPSARMGYGQEP
jgi:acyl-coenzyme A synthetase/AMP-(fatty) acid ligase